MKAGRLMAILLISFMLAVVPSVLLAQFESEKNSPNSLINDDVWSESLVNLKKSMGDIMQKNDMLSSENNVLRKRVLDLEDELKKLQQQKEQDAKEPIRLNQLLQERSNAAAVLEKNMGSLKDKINQLQSEKNILEKTIAQREEKQKSFDKETQNLKEQISLLEKNVKTSGNKDNQQLKDLEEEKKALTKKLEESQQRQLKAQQELTQIKAEPIGKSDQVKSSLSQKNIKADLAKAQEALATAHREKQKLQDENAKLYEQGKGNVAEINQEMDHLKTHNKELENTLAQLKKTSDLSSPSEPTKQITELQDKIVALQDENKALKDKISSHMEAIVKLNREKSMIEALLEAQSKAVQRHEQQALKNASKNKHQIMAYKYAAGGQYEKAIDEYKLALQEEPFKKDIYYNLGFIYSRLGRYEEAVSNYKQVLGLDANDKEANFNLSQIYKKLSDTKNSKYYYDKYLTVKDK